VIASVRGFTDYFDGGRRTALLDARSTAPPSPRELAHLAACHATAGALLAAADDEALTAVVPSLEPGAQPIKAWRLLMAMTEHEVQHRSQLASYLTWMGVEAPDVFGLGVEDVMRLTAEPAGRRS
jgi:uncharacterized damage-inducible protein DinB